MLSLEHTTEDGDQVFTKLYQLQGAQEKFKSPRSMLQKSDGFIIVIGSPMTNMFDQNS